MSVGWPWDRFPSPPHLLSDPDNGDESVDVDDDPDPRALTGEIYATACALALEARALHPLDPEFRTLRARLVEASEVLVALGGSPFPLPPLRPFGRRSPLVVHPTLVPGGPGHAPPKLSPPERDDQEAVPGSPSHDLQIYLSIQPLPSIPSEVYVPTR